MTKSLKKKPSPVPKQLPITRLLLIRHAEVEAKYQRLFGGRIDMNLSPRGKRMALTLAKYLENKTIDAIYASPMKRVQQTIAPTLRRRKLAQHIRPDLREVDFGHWTGLGWKAVSDRFGFEVHQWLEQLEHPGAPNGESGGSFRGRVEPCLREIIRAHPGQNVAVFCHGGVIRMILSILVDLPLPKTNSFEIEYASITQVALHPHMAEIELLNFTPVAGLGGMKRKPLWRVSVATSLEAEDAVSEALSALLGAGACSYYDVERHASLVSVYLEQAAAPLLTVRNEIKAALYRLKDCGLDPGPAIIKIERIRHEDWAESWKRHFKPMEIGRFVLIKPSWSRRRPKKHQEVVILDPGLSFGTGQHPTTSFCLKEVVRNVKNGAVRSLMDIGTGSGILAIVAARLHYQPIRAFDFDPESVRVARANAETNRVGKKIDLARGDATRLPLRPKRRFDLVCANLISTLLLAERKRIISQLNQGGTLVLAGILKTEFQEVRIAYETLGLKLVRTEARNEWQSGAFTTAK